MVLSNDWHRLPKNGKKGLYEIACERLGLEVIVRFSVQIQA
jgi:hypothetical protein